MKRMMLVIGETRVSRQELSSWMDILMKIQTWADYIGNGRTLGDGLIKRPKYRQQAAWGQKGAGVDQTKEPR
jgi:hypothetical protein